MKRMSLAISVFMFMCIGAASVSADDNLTQAAQNPIADMISVPIQANFNFDQGLNDDDTGVVTNIQPVIPVKLNEEWNFIARTIIPIVYQPILNGNDDYGLGDINFQGYFTPAKPGKWIWGVGPTFTFPTATDDSLGSEKYSMGPGIVLLRMQGPWVYGGLINNQWSVAGNDDRRKVNMMLINPFLNYNLPGGWYLTYSPNILANWAADSDNTWTVPVGGGVGRVFTIGKQPVNVKLAAYCNAEKPRGAADWTLQFQFTFLFPEK